MKNLSHLKLVAIVAVAASAVLALAQGPKQVPVTLKAGSTVKISGKLAGRQDVDYVIPVKAGQKLSLSLIGAKASAGFLVMAPGTDTAMLDYNRSGTKGVATMPTDGKARVRVFMVRTAARRGETSPYTLALGLSGTALAPVKGDALVSGTPYHASAEATVTNDLFPDLKTCKVGVIRRGPDGTGTVVFLFKNLKRQVLFVKGKAVASDATDPVASSTKDGNVVTIIGNSETYSFNEALLTGG